MRAGDKPRLGTLRLIMAGIRQREVDERISLDDTQVLSVLEKMVKQRRESIVQFQQAGRDDLVGKETAELAIIREYMPEQIDASELPALVDSVIAEVGATSMRDMGKVMGRIKSKVQGRADMSLVSELVKSRLGS